MINQARDTYGKIFVRGMNDRFPDMSAEIHVALHSEWPERVDTAFVELLEENIIKVTSYLSDLDLEVGLAPSDHPLIIGDVPVVNTSPDGRIGIKAGVRVNESLDIEMPLTPQHLVTVKSNPPNRKYVTLSVEEVDAANNRQRALAEYEYFGLPESDGSERG